MNKEILRMQMLSGIITEGEYKAKLKELNSTENKDSSRYDDLAENIYSSGFSANDTGRPKFHQMTADEIEDYLEKDKDNPSRLFGRSLTLVKSLLKAKREEEKLKEGAFDSPFTPKVSEPQKGGGLQLKNAAMKVYSYIKKNGFNTFLTVDGKNVGDRMNHDFSIQVLTKAGHQGEGVLVIQGNKNKTNPQVVEKLQNDIIHDFPFLKKSNQSNPSQLLIKLEVDPKANVSETLNEHYIAGGIVGVGAINNPFEGRKKESYEDAFEYFLGKKYSLNESEETVAAEKIADKIEDILSPEEAEFLKNAYVSNGKEVVANAIEKEINESLNEIEPPAKGEFGMSQNEIKLRQIIDKLIAGGAVASLAGVIPAMMAGAPFLALGLGIAAFVGAPLKDAAWWSRKGHNYSAQDKYGLKEIEKYEGDLPKNDLKKLEGELKSAGHDAKLSGINLDFILVKTPNKGELQVVTNDEGQYVVQPRNASNIKDKVEFGPTTKSSTGEKEDNLATGIKYVVNYFDKLK